MTTARATYLCALAITLGLGGATPVHAQIGVGTWVRTPAPKGGSITMTVEACCGKGRRLIYHFAGTPTVMTVESPFDGTEVKVFVDGKPVDETMAITRVDDRHVTTVVKMGGKPFGTSKATLSPDGKTLTVENEQSASTGGGQAGKSTETWVLK